MSSGRRWVAVVLGVAIALAGHARPAIAAGVGLDSLRVLLKTGRLAEADSGARVLLAELDAKRAPDSTVARVIDVLTESLWQRGETGGPETMRLADRAVVLQERSFGKNHPEVAGSLQNSAILSAVAGDFPTARRKFERALGMQEKHFGPEDPHVIGLLTGLANVLGDLGDVPGALAAYQRVLKIREKVNGPESPEAAFVLHNIAITNFDARNFEASRAAFDRSLPIWEKSKDPNNPMLPQSLNGYGVLLFAMGEYAAAESKFQRAVAIWERIFGPENPYVAMGLNSIASTYLTRGEYTRVRPILERALAIYEKAFGPEHPYVARVVNSLAVMYASMGDHAAARPYYARSLAIREKVYGAEHIDVARAQMNLAQELQMLGDYAGARTLMERALATDEKLLGPDNSDVSDLLESLGSLNEETGEFETARRMQERSLAIREKTFGPGHFTVANNLAHLADLHARSGDPAGARQLAERELATRVKALGPDHPHLGETLERLARIEFQQGDRVHALDHALAAGRVTLDHVRLTSRALSERQALQYATARASGHDLALTLAAGGLDDAGARRVFDALVHSRAVVLDEMAARNRAAVGARDTSVAGNAAALARARTRLANLVVRGLGDLEPEKYRRLLDEARAEKEQAERAMAAASADFVRESSLARVGADQVAASLPPGAVLVAFAQYDRVDPAAGGAAAAAAADSTRSTGAAIGSTPSYLAFVMHAGSSGPRVVDLGEVAAIDGLIARWKEEASNGMSWAGRSAEKSEAACRAAGTGLRQRVWDPLAVEIAGAERVFVVPDGGLHLVNLGALPAEAGGYLVEHGPLVHYLSAERDLVRPREVAHGTGLLALGAPSYDAPGLFARLREKAASAAPGGSAGGDVSAATYRGTRSACGEFAGLKFEPLPATGAETREIVRLWKSRGTERAALELRGAAASESELKRSSPGRRVLHLATHGFFLGHDCPSALRASRGVGGVSGTPADSSEAAAPDAESPLLLSGLVLAGANQRSSAGEGEDDGILTAEEIASLDLSGVDWAVLSACETGVGDVRAGEGVFGLRRAFQVAGAGTLIMSLWSVDDESTRAWMKALYEGRLGERLDTAAAVQHASLKVLQQRREKKESTHPFYWAAFVAAGDWR